MVVGLYGLFFDYYEVDWFYVEVFGYYVVGVFDLDVFVVVFVFFGVVDDVCGCSLDWVVVGVVCEVGFYVCMIVLVVFEDIGDGVVGWYDLVV